MKEHIMKEYNSHIKCLNEENIQSKEYFAKRWAVKYNEFSFTFKNLNMKKKANYINLVNNKPLRKWSKFIT